MKNRGQSMENLGLQLYSVKEAAEKDLLDVLEQVAEMGYKGVQFAGFYSHSAEEVKEKMDELGLKAAGAHVQISELQDNFDELLAYHEEIGNKVLICPFLSEDMRTTEEDYERTAELFNEIGKKVKEAGFSFGYHNHAFEFDLFDGKTGFDILYENTNPDFVKMELDCFWVVHAGHSPEKIMKQYSDRLFSLHLKDLMIENHEPVSTEIGNGIINIQELIEDGKTLNVNWFIVEQEDFKQDPLESARQNAKRILSMKI